MQSPLIYIMGVSGSGKTTVGKLLSAKTEIPFFDGDDLHSSANKKKMERINSLAIEQQKLSGAIIACSALKEKYRDILIEEIHKPYWVFLNGGFELIQERMKKRKDHFMPTDLLSSQFEILERPSDALTIDISKSPEEIVSIIQNKLQLT
jgi:gluconate kinase